MKDILQQISESPESEASDSENQQDSFARYPKCIKPAHHNVPMTGSDSDDDTIVQFPPKPSHYNFPTNTSKQRTKKQRKKKKRTKNKQYMIDDPLTRRTKERFNVPETQQLDGQLVMVYGSFNKMSQKIIHDRIRKMCGVVLMREEFMSEQDRREPDFVIMGHFSPGHSDVFDKMIKLETKVTNITWLSKLEEIGEFVEPICTTTWKKTYLANRNNKNRKKRKRDDGSYDKTEQTKPKQPVLYNYVKFCQIL